MQCTHPTKNPYLTKRKVKNKTQYHHQISFPQFVQFRLMACSFVDKRFHRFYFLLFYDDRATNLKHGNVTG